MKFTTTGYQNDPLVAAAMAVLETSSDEGITESKSAFQNNQRVLSAQQNLRQVQASFRSPGLIKLVSDEVGEGSKKDFEKISKLLSQVEDIWEEIYMEASQAFDANLK